MRTLPFLLLAFLCSHWAFAQKKLSGKVTEAGDDFGLSGITVTVKGTDISTVTNIYGEFEISAPDGSESLVFSGPGFGSQEIAIGGRTSFTVTMNVSENATSDQISVGFGTQSKAELTSSISQVSAEDFEGAPVIDLEQANQGRSTGLFVQNNGGKLGEGTSVRIRGGSSLSGSNDPLYVVDGVPLSSGSQSDINPSTIESIEVLKDASAAAIYGSRAANGVVLITTKSGNSGKTKIDFDYQFGISQTPKTLDLLNPAQYNAQALEFGLRDALPELELLALLGVDGAFAQLLDVEDALAEGSAENFQAWAGDGQITLSDGRTIALSNGEDGTVFRLIGQVLDSLTFNTDWQDEIFRNAASHRANLNISGGAGTFDYYGGLSFTDQEGILIGNDYQRFNGRLNLNNDFSSAFSANLSLNYAYTNDNRLNEDQDLGSPLQAIVLPSSDGFDPANNYQLNVRSLEYNPLTEINFADNVATGNSIIGNLGLKYDINDNLSVNVDGGADLFELDEERRQGPQTQEGTGTGLSRLTNTQVSNYILNGYVNYDADLANNQSLSVLLGSNYQTTTTETSFRSARVNSISTLESLGETDPSLLNIPIPDSKFAFLSFYTRLNYNIQDKYIFQLSARADGSSRFSEDNRIGYFPAVSAGWNIHNEDFFSSDVFSLLKFKASFGLVGNTPDEDFLYRRNFINVMYGDEEGVRLSNLSNEDLKWETTAQTDVGLDVGLLNDRIALSANYYIKSTSDLLFPVPVTQTSGFSFILQNIGSLENRGFEFSLGSTNIQSGDFSWSTDFNISFNENEVTDLGGNRLIVGVNSFQEGQPSGVFFARKFVGVDPSNGAALYDDGNGGTTEDWEAAPRMVVGDPNPDFFGGLSNTFVYQNFDLNFLFQFVQGVDIYNATREFAANSGILNLNQTTDQIGRWYAPGDEAALPALNPFQENTFPSSRFVEDGSYIRLKTVMLTYSFSDQVVANMKLGYLKFYIGGQNLFTITDYSGFDPDVNYVDPNFGTIERNISRGIDNFTAPQARAFITGFKIGF